MKFLKCWLIIFAVLTTAVLFPVGLVWALDFLMPLIGLTGILVLGAAMASAILALAVKANWE